MIINISQDQQIMLHEDPIKCIEIKKSGTQVFNDQLRMESRMRARAPIVGSSLKARSH